MIRCTPLAFSSPERKRRALDRLGVPQERREEILRAMGGLCLALEGLDPETARALDGALRTRSGLLVPGGAPGTALAAAPPAAWTDAIRESARGGGSFALLLREVGACLERLDREPSLLVQGRDLFRESPWLLVGVVNVTPDSFYDGGRYLDPGRAVERGLTLAEEGAHILDVGAESSRPGSDPVPAEEEGNRLLPVVRGLRRALPGAVISADTTKAAVARAALDAGADLINDVSAGRFDPGMLPLAAEHGVPVVLMHMLGTPKTMQEDPSYADPVLDVTRELEAAVGRAEAAGLGPGRIVVDPGIGFGKRPEDNLSLLDSLVSLRSLGHPVLVGASRKSLIGKVAGAAPEDRLPGSIALHVLALAGGARLFRVHDVGEHRQALEMAWAVREGAPEPSP